MKILKRLFSLIITASILFSVIHAQQVADPTFDAKVAHPAYPKHGPKVLFDEAHNNFHTASGRYKPFADLITNDGYQVMPNKQKFSAETLKGYDILLISNALGAPRMNMPEASNPAFAEAECDAVRDWVKAGGSLLLIADQLNAELLTQAWFEQPGTSHYGVPRRDVLELPAGEHDYFERKSGALFVSQDFRRDVAKGLSAFANSGGII